MYFFIYIIINILIFILMLSILTLIHNMTNKNKEKNTNFECGFNNLSSSNNPFSIKFFKIILIFLLFDIEIIIMLPMPLFEYHEILSFMILMLILIIITFGLLFEWYEGSLNWV
uniref:NADH-ubiquinone oxidoreductase chain 3 n=1 Tax=Blattisocius keegani TaxID=2337216 RepID=A0A4Y5QDM2_9ACAR|nr:NADH dehydrogenase subunit 3 [Blattisocius keegani]